MIKNIIFDFDGVILNSIPIKTDGFRELFRAFDKQSVDRFIKYHIDNSGQSRYVKIKYFFEKILNKNITQEEIENYAHQYSTLTKKELTNSKYLIEDTMEFIKNNYKEYNMHIASGADERDLIFICDNLHLTQYFLSITGSPIVKYKLIENILISNSYKISETIFIGDSINDYDAACTNSIKFFGYNNKDLKKYNYIDQMSSMNLREKEKKIYE